MGLGQGASGGEQAAARPAQLVAFVAADVECALPIERVREVLEVGALGPHTGGAGDFRGAMATSTGLAAVLDLRARLGYGETAPTRTTCMLVLDLPSRRDLPLALLVEGVRDLVDLPRADITPAPRLGGVSGPFGAVARLPGRLLPVLDLDRLLTEDDAVRAKAILTRGPDAAVPADARPPTT